jgi:hypothetical protein
VCLPCPSPLVLLLLHTLRSSGSSNLRTHRLLSQFCTHGSVFFPAI